MDFNGRRRGPQSGGGSVPKAVGIGIVTGLLISVAIFVHKRQVDDLKFQIQAQANDHERVSQEERQMRELAEQSSTEADAERSSIQNKLKDRDGAILAAKKEAKESQERVKEAEANLAKLTEKAGPNGERAGELQKEIDSLKLQLKTTQEQVEAAKLSSLSKVSGGHDRHAPWKPSPERDAQDPELAELLKKIAINSEVMVAVCNKNLAQPDDALDIWIRNVNRVGIENAMVVALDDETEKFCQERNMKSIRIPPLRKNNESDFQSNHAVSAMKFTYLQRFLKLGYSVFLSDVDIIFFQDPFKHVYRDSDVEGMSDGWTNQTAYGFNDVDDDPSMGWARYAHSMRVFCMNSGLFFIRPTEAALDLLKTTVYRIDTEHGWDQAIFNEVLYLPSANERQEVAVTKRVLCRYKFMNSKTLFKEVRYDPGRQDPPVSLHVNFHANKLERLLAAEQYWIYGDKTGLMEMKIKS